MAKYTELLAEYLEGGGELPTAFNQIDGFTDLFIGHFCDKELGFETEILFQIKLETRANLVIPAYAERITAYKTAIAQLGNPIKTRSSEVNAGEQNSQSYSLPFNSPNAAPNAKAHTDAFKNNDVTTESGLTPDEAIRLADKYEDTIHFVELALLHEFDNLFMQVY